MADMTVAVVIPNLNYGRWLGRAIESAKNQTVAPNVIIVVDGGSTDNSLEVVFESGDWFREGSGLHIELMPGLGRARNVGIRRTGCDFIVPLDADDWLDPNYIEMCLVAFDQAKGPVGIVAPGLRWRSESGEDVGRLLTDDPICLRRFLLRNRIFYCSMFRRQVWEDIGGYDVVPSFEDWDFWTRAVAAGWDIATIGESLFNYTSHEDSLTGKLDDLQRHRYLKYFQTKHAALFAREGL